MFRYVFSENVMSQRYELFVDGHRVDLKRRSVKLKPTETTTEKGGKGDGGKPEVLTTRKTDVYK